MAKRPRLDLRRLARDAAAAPGAQRANLAPGGRAATGLMDAVRADLDALFALQAGGLTWNAIAAGLTAQGLTTADGRAITGRNLTGVISSIRRQAQRGATRDAERKTRADVRDEAVATSTSASAIQTPEASGSASPRPALSLDLIADAAVGSRSRLSDAERRIAALARARSLLKKD
ncbi:hypothetical protein [Methylobacterium planeticum]|uniref:Uncharacterized protein n=1 Tax=Methylobacterium planeticum TaxID=2615211 RepID=A0A6N6MLH7_9HYPH|nr:hypothetical protein [Methylobacterium planeticum]KAB1070582.1 hypothetical protein F6X51_22210 [Methylobacterium planeticum]